MKYDGEDTKTVIGDNAIIREFVTINKGTEAYGKTVIGNNVLLMACTHIAHDCIIGDNVIMANIATLGGHVEIGNWCNIGGGAMIHQFVKIGQHSLIGGGFSAKQDVPPFIIGAGIPLRFVGINKIGIERRGFTFEKTALNFSNLTDTEKIRLPFLICFFCFTRLFCKYIPIMAKL